MNAKTATELAMKIALLNGVRIRTPISVLLVEGVTKLSVQYAMEQDKLMKMGKPYKKDKVG